MENGTYSISTSATRLGRTLALGIALAVTVAVPASAAPSSARQLERAAVDGVVLEPLRLDCVAVVSAEAAGVRCRWSAPTAPDAVGVRLVRLTVGSDAPRTTVFRTDDLAVTTFADGSVRPATRVAYAVQALNAAGRIVSASPTVRVGVPKLDEPTVEVVELGCVAATTEPDERGRIGCTWSLPAVSEPRTLTLWRSVDGAAREQVRSFSAPFPTSYRDVVPTGTRRVVYAIVGTDGDGRIVSRSRPAGVSLPARPERPTPPAEPVLTLVMAPTPVAPDTTLPPTTLGGPRATPGVSQPAQPAMAAVDERDSTQLIDDAPTEQRRGGVD